MREIGIIIVVVIIIVVASWLVQNYIEKTSDEITFQLEELKSQIKQSKTNNNKEEAVKTAESALQKWEEVSKNWSMVVVHEELDKIELSLLEVKAAVETESYDDSLEEIDKSIFLVRHIKEKEALKIKNIF